MSRRRRYRKNPFGISPVWFAAAGGVLYLWKAGKLDFLLGKAKPKFYMAARFTEDGHLVGGGDQCYSIDQKTWVDRSNCGR